MKKVTTLLAALLGVAGLAACAPGAPGVTNIGFSPNKTYESDGYATNLLIYPTYQSNGRQDPGFYKVLARSFTNGSDLWCFSDRVSADPLNTQYLRAERGHEYFCDTPEALRLRYPGQFGE